MAAITPQILDAQGNRLAVGDRVERAFGEFTGGAPGEVLGLSPVNEVVVAFTQYGPVARFETTRRFTLRRSYRCPDLQRIDDPQEGEKR